MKELTLFFRRDIVVSTWLDIHKYRDEPISLIDPIHVYIKCRYHAIFRKIPHHDQFKTTLFSMTFIKAFDNRPADNQEFFSSGCGAHSPPEIYGEDCARAVKYRGEGTHVGRQHDSHQKSADTCRRMTVHVYDS